MYTYFWLFLGTLFTLPTVVAAQGADTIPGFIIAFSGFLRDILLPLLFSIAFLYFIYNMAQYFIFKGEESGSREKGKRSAIYGIAAFVFLISIWAIVGMFTRGLGIERTGVICADYFRTFGRTSCSTLTPNSIPETSFGTGGTGSGAGGGGNLGGGGGTGGGAGSSGGGSTPGGGSTGAGSTGGVGGGGTGAGGGTTGGGSTAAAPLAELIFGTGRDSAGYHRSLVPSGALASTPSIQTTASCTAGFETLTLAARAESVQAAYLFFQTSTGQRQWLNVTDRSMGNYIGYDRDVIDDIIADGGQNLTLVHVHPDSRGDALNLTATGLPPSAADLRLVCTLNNPAIRYVVVDESGVWEVRQTPTTCPHSPTALTNLSIIETYLTLATLEASTRATELSRYLASPLVPAQVRTVFENLAATDLASESEASLIARSLPYQTEAATSITRQSASELCSSI